MEARGGGHFWGRAIGKLGHEVGFTPPVHVDPFVKRQKNDMADAEAICEVSSRLRSNQRILGTVRRRRWPRPTMRFVPVKGKETQGDAMVYRIRELLIRQRTQAINALRGHPSAFDQIEPPGAAECRATDRDRRGSGQRPSRRCNRNVEGAGRSPHPSGDGDQKARCRDCLSGK